MELDKRVLACVDRSPYADHVADYAAWAARKMDAPLEFLHIIDRHQELGASEDRSGSIGIDAQEVLLTELADRDALRTTRAREDGRIFLNQLRERAIRAGVAAPDIRQRYGDLENRWSNERTAYACLFSAGGESPPIPPVVTLAATWSAWCGRCGGRYSR